MNILDTLPFQSAILDSKATLISVNQSWRDFGRDNGAPARVAIGVGCNYLSVCRSAHGRNSTEAAFAENAITRILDGRESRAAFEYPCSSPRETRTFLFAASAIPGAEIGVFVSHIDISMRSGAERTPPPESTQGAPRDSQNSLDRTTRSALDDIATTLRWQIKNHLDVQALTNTASWEVDGALRVFRWTDQAYIIFGRRPEKFAPTLDSVLGLFRQREADDLRLAFVMAEKAGQPFDLELPTQTGSGRRVWIRFLCRIEFDGPRVKRLYGAIQDITRHRSLSSADRANVSKRKK